MSYLNRKAKWKASDVALIVEDEEDLADLLAQNLEFDGLRTLKTRTVKDAIKKLRNQAFKVILLDIRLGNEMGSDVVFYIRDHQGGLNLETPVVVVSGHLDKYLMVKLKDLIQGAIIKPFDGEQLVERVRNICKA